MDGVIRFLADDTLLVIMAVTGAALLRGVRREHIVRDYSYVTMAGLTSLLIGKLLSLLYQPSNARPFLELGAKPGAEYIDNPGFPSDHMLLAAVCVLAVYAVTSYTRVAYALAGLALLMGVGRVLALVHTPLDIVGGVVAASLGGLWYVAWKRHFK